jgi:hypothetical protein
MLTTTPIQVLNQAWDFDDLVNSGMLFANEAAGQTTLTTQDAIISVTGFAAIASSLGTVQIDTGSDVNITPVGFVIQSTMALALPDVDDTEFPDGFALSIQLGDPLVAGNYNENVASFSQMAMQLGIVQIDTGAADANISPVGMVITSSFGTPVIQVPSGSGSTSGPKGKNTYRTKLRRDR